jgi:hypothetical protein
MLSKQLFNPVYKRFKTFFGHQKTSKNGCSLFVSLFIMSLCIFTPD